MINREKLVVDLVESFRFSGFTHDDIYERDVFLSYVVICFINQVESGFYTPILKRLTNVKATSDIYNIFTGKVKYKTPLHEKHFLEFVAEANALNSEKKIQALIGECNYLLNSSTFESTFLVDDLVLIYDHVLQRLQFMNVADRLNVEFDYQEPPFDFSSLITLLADKKGKHKAYDPYATTGESSVTYAIQNQKAEITTESVFQTAKYIKHKLLIAGASNIDSKHAYSLSSKSNVKENYFDVAYTLFLPTETNEVVEYEKLKKHEKIFVDGRVDASTIFDKYREHGFIQHMLWSLKDDGIGFVVLSKGPLHRQFESDARNLLLKNNYVDAVIQLPPKLLTSRTVPLFILVLRKNKRKNKKIKFIDASAFCKFESRRNQLVDIKKIADLYHKTKSNNEVVSIVDIDNIDSNAALLTVSSYVSSASMVYEEIDVDIVRGELAQQQRYTDNLLAKIK